MALSGAELKQKLNDEMIAAANPFSYHDNALPVAIDGRRLEVEFWCGNCLHYIYVKVNMALGGNHIMVCPNCGHKHYRYVRDGIITSDRWEEGAGIADEIIPMKSACVPKESRRQRGEIALLREMEACGLLR